MVVIEVAEKMICVICKICEKYPNTELRFLAMLGLTGELLKITVSFLEKYNFIGDKILTP